MTTMNEVKSMHNKFMLELLSQTEPALIDDVSAMHNKCKLTRHSKCKLKSCCNLLSQLVPTNDWVNAVHDKCMIELLCSPDPVFIENEVIVM